MRVVLQRVSSASVRVNGSQCACIDMGLLILVGVEAGDTAEDVQWLCPKITQLRIFNDAAGKMNLSLMDVDAQVLVVSQFTLHSSTRKGNRPSFIKAAPPSIAAPLYEEMCAAFEHFLGKPTQKGIFGAHMEVELVNDGPVTILMDSKNRE